MLDAYPTAQLDAPHEVVAPASAPAPAPCGSRPAWCVVRTHPKAERRAHAALHHFGFKAFLPLVTVRRPNRHYHTAPLWPCYVFVRLDLAKPWHPVTAAPGVFHLLMTDGQPARCPDHALEAVQSALHGAEAFPAVPTRWSVGTPCSLAVGPLAGMSAIVTQVGTEMATIAVMMLGQLREVAVSLDVLSPREH